jgi:hypothetical protein
VKDGTLCEHSALSQVNRWRDHRCVSGWVSQGRRSSGLLQIIKRVSVKSKFSSISISFLVVFYPFFLIVVPSWILSLWSKKVKIVQQKISPMISRDLHNFKSLLGQTSSPVLFEIFEHHAVADKLLYKHRVLGFPGGKLSPRLRRIGDESGRIDLFRVGNSRRWLYEGGWGLPYKHMLLMLLKSLFVQTVL